MTFIINTEEHQHILDRFDYLSSRCTGDEHEAKDVAAGIEDRAALLELLHDHIDTHHSLLFDHFRVWWIVANPRISLPLVSGLLKGVRCALEASLAAYPSPR